MDFQKKLEFVHKMAKLGLQHFDGGGVISGSQGNPLSGVSGALTTQNTYNASAPVQESTIGAQETGLAGQLQTEAAGAGPNPAQIQYQQNAQNIAQRQAALNAQNRAINPGLAARLSGNSAVQAGQQAAGTAAAQQAQQQLAAQGELGSLAGTEQQGLNSAQGINAQVSQNNANAVQNTQGGILSSIPVIGSLFAEGGEVHKYASGGSIQTPGVPTFSNADDLPDMHKSIAKKPSPPTSSLSAPSDNAALGANPFSIAGVSDTPALAPMAAAPILGSSAGIGSAAAAPSLGFSRGGNVGPRSHVGMMLAKGGKPKMSKSGDVPAMVSPGEISLTPQQAKAVADGKSNPMKVGEKIKGHAKVSGDSLKNDTVPKMLKNGGMVIDRETVQMGPEKAAEFVRRHLSKKGIGLK